MYVDMKVACGSQFNFCGLACLIQYLTIAVIQRSCFDIVNHIGSTTTNAILRCVNKSDRSHCCFDDVGRARILVVF